MNRFNIFILIVFISYIALSLDTNHFRFIAPIEGQDSPATFRRILLPELLVAKLDSNYGDLRLLDETNNETPFSLRGHFHKTQPPRRFELKVLKFDISKQGKEEIVLERPEGTTDFDSLALSISASDFKKYVLIESSNSLGQWKTVGTDVIFDFSSKLNLRKTELSFVAINERYLRISLTDSSPSNEDKSFELNYERLNFKVDGKSAKTFKIHSFMAEKTSPLSEQQHLLETVLSSFGTHTDETKNTVIKIENLNLNLLKAQFKVENSYFYRRVECFAYTSQTSLTASGTSPSVSRTSLPTRNLLGNGYIFKIPGMYSAQTSLSLKGRPRHLEIVIHNGNNPPLSVKEISFLWDPVFLYFIPIKGKTYSLYFGADSISQATYETDQLLGSEGPQPSDIADWTLGDTKENPAFCARHPDAKKNELIERMIFSAVIVVLVLITGFWIFKLVRRVSV